ncbi:MAG: sensor histidine kinase, partial [Hyphomicrobiaceae bacterium]
SDGNIIEEVRQFEYRQLKNHQKWLKENHPTRGTAKELNVPMIGGSEIITSDNSLYAKTGNDADRSGLMFSVPFYGPDGVLKGSVTAVILSNVIREILPPQNFTLLNGKYNYFSRPLDDGQERKSEQWISLGAPDPNLFASNVIDVAAYDPRSKWLLWAGLPNAAFDNSAPVRAIWLFEIGGYLGLALLMSLLLFMQWLGKARAKAKRATKMAAETRRAHEKTLQAEREMRRLNEELQANMKMLSETQMELVKHERLAALGQVTATLSHEIRNPLGAIRSSLYVVRQAAEKAQLKLDRPLDRIERSVSRCDNLIDDFLEYTRTHKLSICTVDASQYLNELLDEQALPESVTLIRELPVPGIQIAVDPERFRRVIINLVENAAQAIKEKGDEGGEINVACRLNGDGSLMSVQDNGPGIPDDVIDKIFEPLFTTKSFGAGLGLATVKQLVEQHEAELTIDTKCGVGSTFSVFLPPAHAVITTNNEPVIQEKAA